MEPIEVPEFPKGKIDCPFPPANTHPIFILRMKSCVYEFIQIIDKRITLIGRTMVTQKMWEEITGYNPSDFKGDNIPVTNVSYIQIKEFIAKLTELTSEHCGYRLFYSLMSEPEYEDAAGMHTNVFGDTDTIINAGLSTGFSGLDICCAENSGNRPREVALTPPNEHGLYDMYGNVWEICQGVHEAFISLVPRDSSSGKRDLSRLAPKRSDYDDESSYKRALLKCRLLSGGQPVLKGGAWNMPKDSCVKETYLLIGENDKFSNAGFRLTVSIYKQ